MKFTEQGEIIVNADLDNDRGTQVVVRVTVRDSGVGIIPAAQANLFDPFFQGNASTTRKFGGTGLGLAISKQLVGLMAGAIGVKSPAVWSNPSRGGPGSEFWITIALDKAEVADATRLHAIPSLDGMRVLVVESNRGVGETLRDLSLSLGCDVVSTEDVENGRRLLRQAVRDSRPFSVVLVDDLISAPDREEFGRHFKGDPGTVGTRLITLTATRDGELDSQIIGDNSTFLLKPVSRYSLARALSLTPVDDTPVATELVTPAIAPISDQPMGRILLAEDNPVNREIMSAMLEFGGYSCERVTNGIEAVEAITRCDYDLVLMDCEMPEMDGFEATRTIRGRDTDEPVYDSLTWNGKRYRVKTPIIALTAHAMQGYRKQCLAAGMDDYLAKPCSCEELFSILNKWLGHGTTGEEHPSG